MLRALVSNPQLSTLRGSAAHMSLYTPTPPNPFLRFAQGTYWVGAAGSSVFFTQVSAKQMTHDGADPVAVIFISGIFGLVTGAMWPLALPVALRYPTFKSNKQE